MKRNPHSFFPINDNLFLKKNSCCLLVCGKWGKADLFAFGILIVRELFTSYPQPGIA